MFCSQGSFPFACSVVFLVEAYLISTSTRNELVILLFNIGIMISIHQHSLGPNRGLANVNE